MTRFAVLALIVLAAAGWSGSSDQDPAATGTISFTRGSQLWVMQADRSGQRKLARGGGPGGPAWSRDGRRIAYGVDHRGGGSHLAVIDADGRNARRLSRPRLDYEDDLDLAWSPDGRRIAFTRFDSDPNYAIYIVDVRGGRERKLTPWIWPRGAFAGPTWAPGGRKLAFNHVHRGAVYVIRPDGGGLRVWAKPATSRTWGVKWSPDGSRIAFIGDDYLWVMNASGTGARMLTDVRVDNPGARRADYAWSPDGRRIAFTRCCLEYEIFVVDADGSGLQQLTDNDRRVRDTGAVWSPDGRSIAFTSNRDGNDEIYVMDADGGNERNVSRSPLADHSPAWSPRG